MGIATIADVHFQAACLYSGLEAPTLGFKLPGALVWIGLEDGLGAGLGLEDAGKSARPCLGAECCCGCAKRPGSAAALCLLFVDDELTMGSGASTFGMGLTAGFVEAFGAGAGAELGFAAAVVFAAAGGFASAAVPGVALAFAAFAFVASVFFARVAVLTSFSAATAAAVALVEDFFVLVVVLALEAFAVGATVAMSLGASFIACAFFGRVVETCRTL